MKHLQIFFTETRAMTSTKPLTITVRSTGHEYYEQDKRINDNLLRGFSIHHIDILIIIWAIFLIIQTSEVAIASANQP